MAFSWIFAAPHPGPRQRIGHPKRDRSKVKSGRKAALHLTG